ncbi:ribosomal protein L1-like protein [Phakopsora pachyrhizi]|uniref:Ribosomal protein L1-like protein n=1 Tax=Phakopsora pachyrhizi TaxID=170000 RepID=A0AAV0BG61_PHAPC|nr:ribosomal protein L1-like protein [Phakopsora pachyrhizi]CAH7686155.1 ribosomal protein L1-like protein [Phakopsora pachyrhizi]
MRGRLFLPNQLPKLKSAEEDEELIAIIWPIETLIKDFNKDQKKTEHQIYLNDLSESLGVDHIGGKELIDQIIEGKINPTKLLCHPDLLPLLIKDSRVAKVLGPRGLIPSEKRGTVSTDLNRLVQDAKGSLDWVMDPNSGLVIAELGKLSMDLQAIEQNLMVLVDTVGDLAQGGQAGIKKVVLEAPGLPEIIVT